MRRAIFLISMLLLLVGLYVSCGQTIDADDGMGNKHGLDMANFDDSCKPCDDFYQYSNGGWLADNPLREEYSSWSVTHEMYERNNTLLKEILNEASEKTGAEAGSNWQMVGDLYYSAMDTVAIEEAGSTPLDGIFGEINAITSADDLLTLLGKFHVEGQGCLFDIDIQQDLIDNTKYIIYAGQGGLGLPDRDYYFKEDDESAQIRAKYVEHVTNMFALTGETAENAAATAETVMAIETRLASKSKNKTDMRNPAEWYDYKSLDEANKITSSIDWKEYLKSLNQPGLDGLSLTQADFFREVNAMLTEVSIDDWKSYVRWHVLTGAAPYLSSGFVNEDFQFYSAELRGTEKLRIRWKRVLSTMNYSIGEALGQLFVERAFPPATKARALEMIANVRTALKGRLENLAWMSDETKAKALTKLSTFTPKIGYPDKWQDFSKLTIDRGPYVLNLRRVQAYEKNRQFDKIGKPVDKTEWGMPPQVVNAYYNPQMNEVVFPAGIMQPPFFDGEIDDAINYGAMGAVIGHEIMHGFDDQGSKFDADGNFTNWWTAEDRTGFEARTAKIIAQFDKFIPVDSTPINGSLTQGENIGDLGGLLIAYGALQIAREGKEDPMIDGFTQNQRFFFSWSQAWRNKARDADMKLQINTDPHSIAKYRVLGPFQNLKEFQDAFGCQDGDKMVAADEDRVSIW